MSPLPHYLDFILARRDWGLIENGMVTQSLNCLKPKIFGRAFYAPACTQLVWDSSPSFVKCTGFIVIGEIKIIPSALSDLKDNTIHSVLAACMIYLQPKLFWSSKLHNGTRTSSRNREQMHSLIVDQFRPHSIKVVKKTPFPAICTKVFHTYQLYLRGSSLKH